MSDNKIAEHLPPIEFEGEWRWKIDSPSGDTFVLRLQRRGGFFGWKTVEKRRLPARYIVEAQEESKDRRYYHPGRYSLEGQGKEILRNVEQEIADFKRVHEARDAAKKAAGTVVYKEN